MTTLNGVYTAIVTSNVDPQNSGRVKVRVPAIAPPSAEVWARVATLTAGKNRGSWFMPDVNVEVLVAFEAGDARRPFVLGALWSSTAPPPETVDATNTRKTLRSRNGVKLTMNDQTGHDSFIIETPGGQKITLKDGPSTIEITDNNGNSVRLGMDGVTVKAAAKVIISTAQLQINAASSKFSGTLQCDTLISNSVVSANYSPGAGNIM